MSLFGPDLPAGAFLLRGFVADATRLLADIDDIAARAPHRRMVTPGGRAMSVATTSCGAVGWTSSASGYRYSETDPETGQPWPAMPERWRDLAGSAASRCGFEGFEPDSCLVNRYEPGARLTAHQDRNEDDMTQPIVSVSLGLPAVFRFGGAVRGGAMRRVELGSGDVMVWGGPARLAFHAVDPLRDAVHPLTGRCRINLTFRRAR